MATGELLWRIPFTTEYEQNIVTPVLYRGTLIFSGIGNGVIGVKKELVVNKFLNGMPVRFEPATGDVRLCAVVIDCDEKTGKARDIERLVLS